VPVDRVERKLAAIFAADIAGYSRLMGRDEVGTLTRLKAFRVIVDELIEAHRGRIFNTAGDSVVADFASAVDAVQCAVAVQEAIAKENASSSADELMQFRIGVHVGDVIVDGDNLLGDSVNITARLQSLADPGAICISLAARDHIGNKLPVAFDELGDQQVKNIARPIRVYRVRINEPTVQHATVLPLPDKPSVAVLPFTNMSSDADQEFFADGVAEDIITALSRYPSLFVIARNSSFTYKGRAVDMKQVGRELGVRYVLEGSLRKAGNHIRMTAQLIEGETGNHVWAERYDRDLADIFAVQDEITEAVTTAIAPAIANAEQQRAMRKPPDSLDAWAAYQRGLWHANRYTGADNATAAKYFQQAIDFDPNFSGGYKGLAIVQQRAAFDFQTASPTIMKSVEALARRAVALDSSDAESHTILSQALRLRGDFTGALAEAERALSINPNLAEAHGVLGVALLFSGQPKEGVASLETSFKLDPYARSAPRMNGVTMGLYFSREYEATIEAARRAIRLYPDYPHPYRWLAAALGQLGRTAEAKEALEIAARVVPGSFDTYVHHRVPWHRPEDHTHMLEGLRKAGWDG
jgi:adenylate cyclase